jgi:hypothetical protein
MRNRANSGVVEDIWMNTRADADDAGAVTTTGADAPTSWSELEEANALLNPDAISMDNRG